MRDLITNEKGDPQPSNFQIFVFIYRKLVEIHKPEEVFKLLTIMEKNRSTAETGSNERSSRSHCIFQLSIQGKNHKQNKQSEGTLNLIDLAGSERLRDSKSEGDRLKETQYINKSLSALGNVITSLGTHFCPSFKIIAE